MTRLISVAGGLNEFVEVVKALGHPGRLRIWLHFRPVIHVATNGEEPARVATRTHRALESAQKYSLVANSVTAEIVVESEVIVDPDQETG